MERIKQNSKLNFESNELIEKDSPFWENMDILEAAGNQYDEIINNNEMSEKTNCPINIGQFVHVMYEFNI